MNAHKNIPIHNCCLNLHHPQPPTPLTTDDTTKCGIIHGIMKQFQSNAIDMCFNWLTCWYDQDQFDILWEPGHYNLGDYPIKHHSDHHHCTVHPIYLP